MKVKITKKKPHTRKQKSLIRAKCPICDGNMDSFYVEKSKYIAWACLKECKAGSVLIP